MTLLFQQFAKFMFFSTRFDGAYFYRVKIFDKGSKSTLASANSAIIFLNRKSIDNTPEFQGAYLILPSRVDT